MSPDRKFHVRYRSGAHAGSGTRPLRADFEQFIERGSRVVLVEVDQTDDPDPRSWSMEPGPILRRRGLGGALVGPEARGH
ncbi:MAG: hypothetical protein AAGF11_54435 [Myxococcota bacterium]